MLFAIVLCQAFQCGLNKITDQNRFLSAVETSQCADEFVGRLIDAELDFPVLQVARVVYIWWISLCG